MASSPEFVRYVCEQLADAGEITCKRMFGEYGLWCDGRFFATIEDGMLCLKITDAGRAMLPDAEIVEPHEGARFLYVAELDDGRRAMRFLRPGRAAKPALERDIRAHIEQKKRFCVPVRRAKSLFAVFRAARSCFRLQRRGSDPEQQQHTDQDELLPVDAVAVVVPGQQEPYNDQHNDRVHIQPEVLQPAGQPARQPGKCGSGAVAVRAGHIARGFVM